MALSKDTPLMVVEGLLQSYPLYRALKPYEGSMVFRKSDGYACLTSAAANPFLGHAWAAADNSAGGDGDVEVYVRSGRYRAKVSISALAITDVGKAVYASDDGTLTLTATAHSYVGRVTKWISTGVGIVEFQSSGAAEVTCVQQAHIADAPAGGTGATAGAYDTAQHRDDMIAAINAILSALEAAGILASS
jgi:hypothetical protein